MVFPIAPDTLAVHAPPDGFVPPPPNMWANMIGLHAACGTPAPSGEVHGGYGEMALVEDAVRRGLLKAVWCPLCYPRG